MRWWWKYFVISLRLWLIVLVLFIISFFISLSQCWCYLDFKNDFRQIFTFYAVSVVGLMSNTLAYTNQKYFRTRQMSHNISSHNFWNIVCSFRIQSVTWHFHNNLFTMTRWRPNNWDLFLRLTRFPEWTIPHIIIYIAHSFNATLDIFWNFSYFQPIVGSSSSLLCALFFTQTTSSTLI